MAGVERQGNMAEGTSGLGPEGGTSSPPSEQPNQLPQRGRILGIQLPQAPHRRLFDRIKGVGESFREEFQTAKEEAQRLSHQLVSPDENLAGTLAVPPPQEQEPAAVQPAQPAGRKSGGVGTGTAATNKAARLEAVGAEGTPPSQPPEAPPRGPEFPEDEDRVPTVEALVDLTKERESDPQFWMQALHELHNLPNEERDVREREYDHVCQILRVFADSDKFADKNPKVAVLEQQLKEFEKQEIARGNRTEEEKEVLRNLLLALTLQENELLRVTQTLKLEKEEDKFFSKRKWQEIKDRKEKLQNDPQWGIAGLRAEIQSRTSPNFLSDRKKYKDNLDQATILVKEEEKEIKRQGLEEQRGEVDEWILKQEISLLRDEDKEPELKEPAENLPPFAEVLEFFTQQQNFKDQGSSEFWLEGYNRAKEALSWYFHQARELNIVDDIEERLDHKYQQWVSSLTPHRAVSPDGSSRIVRKTFSEIQDEIIEYFDDLLNPSRPQFVEHDKRWIFLQRRGLTPSDRRILQGIREEFVRRAQIQIEDSLNEIDSQVNKGQAFSFTPTERISGEWNVHRLERKIRQDNERQEARESTTHFRHEHWYTFEIIAENRAQVELGADQAADYIIRSATSFSLDVAQQRLEYLVQGIERTWEIIKADEGISKKEAEGIVLEIQRAVTNKVDLFILEWTGANLLMDQFAGYYSNRFRQDGEGKIKAIPAMNDGLAGLAIHWLTSPQFELYHRPQGFRGQLFNNDTTHKFIRRLTKEQIIDMLMEYELKGVKNENLEEIAENKLKLKDSPSIYEYLQLFNHLGVIPEGIIPEELIPADESGKKDPAKYYLSLNEQDKWYLFDGLEKLGKAEQLFKSLTADQRKEIRKIQYDHELEEVKGKKVVTFEDLAKVREAKKRHTNELRSYQTIRSKAESAFDTADKALTVFGESAFLGSPSIIMENGPEIIGPEGQKLKKGDYISINDYVLVQKYAILQTDHNEYGEKNGRRYQIKDTESAIRFRSKMFIKAWHNAGLDRNLARTKYVKEVTEFYKKKGQKPPNFMLNLAKGFEETGLTQQEWDTYVATDKKFKEKGFLMEVNGVKFEDIVKMDELQPVLNNFLADYKSSESDINDPYIIEKAATGKLVSIANIRKRLGLSGLQRFDGTTQQQIDEYTQRIEDSRSLHSELEKLAYFAASHDLQKPPLMIERGHPVYAFSADRIDYGYQRQSWGVKRLHHLKAFWYTNLRRTVPRMADIIHAMPFSLTSLRREHAFDSFLQMCWDVVSGTTGTMESIDNPSLVAMGNRHQAMVVVRANGEGSISDKEWKKQWGVLEKPFVDGNSVLTLMQILRDKDIQDSVAEALKNPHIIDLNIRERIVNYLQETTFSRFMPMIVATEKSLGEDRQALSAGSGYEENEKFALRYLEWVMSDKSGSDREKGGFQVQEEIVEILKIITKPNSYRDGSSLWDEYWRKQTPSHNPRIPNRLPSLTYYALAA